MKKNLGFLESEFPPSSAEEALFYFIPVPFELSVSYGTGTAGGPAAILKASQNLEAFDCYSVPGAEGIRTHPPILLSGSAVKTISAVEKKVASVLRQQSIPVLLGGEHTVSLGAFKALSKLKDRVGIIQFDAHADLRHKYCGNLYSHACVMRRAYELELPFIQIGTRSYSESEHLFRKENKVKFYDAEIISSKGTDCIKIDRSFPEKVYISFDIDALDPSIMPATGTPEPGGLTWYDAMNILGKITAERKVIGFDVVELSPIRNFHAPDFTAARLIYNLMGMITRSRT